MAIVTKTIGGRKYRYQQTSKRVHGKVKTTSIYIGPLEPRRRTGEGWLKGQMTRRRGLPDEAEMLAQYNAKVEREEAKFNSELDKLHTEFGLKMPTVSVTGEVEAVAKAASEASVPDEAPAPALAETAQSAESESDGA